jgi:glycosyltransferase involved in cell wall biosynthesis
MSRYAPHSPGCAVKKICFVTTSPLIVNFFLVPCLAALGRAYRVHLAVNPDEDTALAEGHGAEVITLPIRRKISPWSDLRTLAAMVRLFRERRFDAVHSFSPKAGLLATIAGRIAGVPVRIHTYTGQVWMTRSGIMRSLLAAADRTIARFATHLLADSPSQLRVLLELGIVRDAGKCGVLGSGSLSGVDLARFRPDASARAAVRGELGIAPDATVFLFLGRLTRDKGVLDLAQAFASLAAVRPSAVLLLVGPDEEQVRAKIESICGAHAGKLRFAGYTRAPERYIAAADALCLPSYREGFGMVIIEAAAAGIPATGSRIYGITDAIIDGETGLLHTPADANDLAQKMEMLMKDPALRERLGTRARQRAVNEFSQQRLTQALLDYYRGALGE